MVFANKLTLSTPSMIEGILQQTKIPPEITKGLCMKSAYKASQTNIFRNRMSATLIFALKILTHISCKKPKVYETFG